MTTDDLSPNAMARLGGWEPRPCLGCQATIADVLDEHRIACLPPPCEREAVEPFCRACVAAHEEGRLRVTATELSTDPTWSQVEYRFSIDPKE